MFLECVFSVEFVHSLSVCFSIFLWFVGVFRAFFWTLFVQTEASMEKGRPFDFERPYSDLACFWGFRPPGKQEKVKTMSTNGCANLHRKKIVVGRVFVDLNVLGVSVFDSISKFS